MAEQKPVIFLIHGAWHTTAPYRQLLDIFEAKGYTTAAPELPSGAEPMPADPPESDIRCCNKELQWLVDEGKEVVVVAHSYGGVVAPEAALGLGVRERSAKGLAGGVSRVVYLAAFMLEPGRTLEMNAPIDSVPWVEYRVRTPPRLGGFMC